MITRVGADVGQCLDLVERTARRRPRCRRSTSRWRRGRGRAPSPCRGPRRTGGPAPRGSPWPGKNPSPSRPARRAAASVWPPMWIGMLSWAGRGPQVAVGEVDELAVVGGRLAGPQGAQWRPRSRRCAGPVRRTARRWRRTPPPASRRRCRAASGRPTSCRAWPVSLARTTGLRCGRIRMPVARLIVDVDGRHVGQPDQRVGDGRVLAAGHLPRRVVRVRRLRTRPARRRAPPSTATRTRPARRPAANSAAASGSGERAGVGEGDAEVHGPHPCASANGVPDRRAPAASAYPMARCQPRRTPERCLGSMT